MMTAPFRTVSLVLAAGGLAIAAPASALPAAHSSAYARTAPIYDAPTASYDDDHDDRWDRGRHRGWDKRDRKHRYRDYSRYRSYQPRSYYGEPVYRNTRVWRGDDNRYYCRKSDGTTGLLIGGAVGALLGREVAGRGDRTLGAILGAAGGALLGKSIDSGTRCR